jgi:GxxExxY protein
MSWLTTLRRSTLKSKSVIPLIRAACEDIIRDHPTGHTECFYEKLLSQYLYEQCIPFLTQVDCFIQRGNTQVLVGRIDMEVAHSTILELKVGVRVRQADIDQLMKYVRAKQACGMTLRNAAVICFRTDNHVEIVNFDCTEGGEAAEDSP